MGLIVPATFPEHEDEGNELIDALALLRVSTNYQDVERQRDELEQLRVEKGLNYVGILELQGVSGTSTLTNEEICSILAQLEASPKIRGLATSEVSRIARPQRGSDFGIVDIFQRCKKMIWTAGNGDFDLATDDGFDTFIAYAAAAGKELRDIRRRSMSGKLKNAKKGKLNSGSIPFGYILIKRDRSDMSSTSGKRAYMEIHEINAATVRRMFNWALQRVGVNEIARRLNEEGVKSAKAGCVLKKDPKTGKPTKICDGLWSEKVVYQLLTQEAYCGSYWYHRGQPDAIRIPCPVIIERSVWEHVQLLLAANRKTNTGIRHSQKREYLLTSKGWCLLCGERITTKPRPNGKAYYICGHMTHKPPVKRLCTNRHCIDKDLLENTLWDGLWARISDPDTLCGLISDAYQDAPVDPLHEASIAELRSELKRLQSVEKRLRENMDDPDLDRAEAKRKFDHARKSREQKEFALRQAEAKIVSKSSQKPEDESIRALADEIRASEPRGFKERRAVIEAALKRFWTDGNVIDVEVAIPGDRFGGPIRGIHTPGEEKARRTSGSGIYGDQKYAHPLGQPISFKFSLNLR